MKNQASNQYSRRIESLDYLRGIMALSVMLFHYYSWAFGSLDASSLLSKLGIYAVSIFYILSGLSLSIVYVNRSANKFNCYEFLLKRIFRILPLFIVVVSAYIALNLLSKPKPSRKPEFYHSDRLFALRRSSSSLRESLTQSLSATFSGFRFIRSTNFFAASSRSSAVLWQ